jgi:predicted transcriptional regulator
MKPEPSILDEIDQGAEDAADADAGRLIAREDVAAWLDTWGTPDSKPAPASWFKEPG